MMPLPSAPIVALVSLVLALTSGASGIFAGMSYANKACAAAQAKQVQVALQAQQAAQARGDTLTRSLLQQQTQIDVLKQEAHRALTQATTGRPCLGGAALRVLASAPGISVDLPAPTGGAAAALATAGATAGDSTWYSTDTQVAHWAADAGAAFETCRTRLDALIDWNTAP